MPVSVIVPVHNESQSLPELAGRLEAVAGLLKTDAPPEFLIVDDASTDDSWQLLGELARRHKHVKPLRLAARGGKSRALAEGVKQAGGGIILMLDGDLQNAPEDLPKLLEAVMQGCDLAVGRRVRRLDGYRRLALSRVYNGIINRLSGLALHDHNCGLKAMRRAVLDSLPLHSEWHRYLTVLAHWSGFRICEVEVTHYPRRYGRSRYGLARYVRFFLDLLWLMRQRYRSHK